MARHLDAVGMSVVLEDAAAVAGRSEGAAQIWTARDGDTVNWRRPPDALRAMAATYAAAGIIFVPTVKGQVYGIRATQRIVRKATAGTVTIYSGADPDDGIPNSPGKYTITPIRKAAESGRPATYDVSLFQVLEPSPVDD